MDVNSAMRLALIGVLRQVMSETSTSQKALAHSAHVSEQILSDALSPHGTRHFAAEWLLSQDNSFVAAFCKRLAVLRGLDEQTKRAIKAQQIGDLVRLILEGA